ncbi:MAG TPA: DNA recombination protein RmuC [Bacteroidales bacterium]|nr:DNA recombination protein RmuC [Bacteroidales bacterium]
MDLSFRETISMNNTVLILLIIAVCLLAILILIVLFKKPPKRDDLKLDMLKLSSDLTRLDPLMREEFTRNREESHKTFKETREELGNSFSQNRAELSGSLKSFEDKFATNVKEFNDLQRMKFDDLVKKQEQIRTETENKLEKIRETVERTLDRLQQENAKKLDEMRATVDEKLQSTLEKRLTESFNQVSERLQQVHEGLGEMKNLASGVGDLKKVLSNVKTRGILGEIQLGNILENILSPEQYDRNVVTRKGSRENVEYAIKLPGKDELGEVVYLPIDSKFPIETYHQLLDAYDLGNTEIIKSASKAIEVEIKRCARDIRDKYLNPPGTTDFGILFLPVEGLYAEVVRQTSLIETLQRDFKIIITGPTTLAALLNSLQMGFRTLAIQKRTSEVWKVLGAIKTEFGKFGDTLKKAQEKINKASEDIDTLVGARTRKIQSKLRTIQELPEAESTLLLGGETDETPEAEGENDTQ